MKKYYLAQTDFYNRYALVWADDAHPIPAGAGWERISRKTAERLCKEEADRRRYNPACSGYAPELVGPWWIDSYVEPVGDGYHMGFDPESHSRACLMQQTGRVLDVIQEA